VPLSESKRESGRYERELGKISVRNQAVITVLFDDPQTWPETWPTVGTRTLGLMYATTGRDVANATSIYMTNLARQAGSSEPSIVPAGKYEVGKPPGMRSLRATSLGSLSDVQRRVAAGATQAEAVAIQANRWGLEARAEPSRASRQIISDQTLENDGSDRWRGWARNPEPGACQFCTKISNGKVLRNTSDSAQFLQYHKGCRCQATAVYGSRENRRHA
jgi:hypothetical protein